MIELYEPYCLVDPRYFELPERCEDSATRFAVAQRAAPLGWTRADRGTSVVLRPDGVPLPAQGWKVHVSSTQEGAEQTLNQTWDYCIARHIAFKFLRSSWAQLVTNLKYADRGASGKLMTLYPRDESQLHELLEGLGARLNGTTGPYILSDMRWRSGPLYVRYGGFVERSCTSPDGEPVLAVEAPDGTFVPDERKPVFQPPPWVELPAFLAAERAGDDSSAAFPYRVERALHFSNAGGVYLARDSSGQQVVLKEARPFAGLDMAGQDAVARLRREYAALERLAGCGFVPGVIDAFTWGGHEFLAIEYVAGESLHTAVARRHPLAAAAPSDDDIAAYSDWATSVADGVEKHIDVMHSRGIAYCDLHPRNVLLRSDGRTVLVDLELARDLDDCRKPALGAPGFCAPTPRTGRAADRYALACLRLAMFMPLTQMLNRNPASADVLIEAAAERFPIKPDVVQRIRAELAPASSTATTAIAGRDAAQWSAADLDGVRRAIGAGILACASPERDDRLYPGDVGQFRYGGCGLAFGAAGVMLALASADAEVPTSHVDWLVRAVEREPAPRPGLYDGLYGVAYVLDQLGRTDDALRVLERALALTDVMRTGTLFGGLAGAGLGLMHFAARINDGSLLDVAGRIATKLVDLGRGSEHVAAIVRPGLLHGWSGPALLFLRLYQVTGDGQWLDEAVSAIRRERAHAVSVDDGRTYLAESGVVRPFLNGGSAGLSLVIDQLLDHREDDDLLGLQAGLHRACRPELVTEPGLFDGRAGMIYYLARVAARENGFEQAPLVERQIRLLAWHAVPMETGIGFPGRGLLRLSTDLATGSAGVLLALASPEHMGLPFLDRGTSAGRLPEGGE